MSTRPLKVADHCLPRSSAQRLRLKPVIPSAVSTTPGRLQALPAEPAPPRRDDLTKARGIPARSPVGSPDWRSLPPPRHPGYRA